MRVLIVSSWYPPIQSGSSFYSEGLALGLKKRGHAVSVVTTDWKLKDCMSQDQDGILVHRLPARVLPRLPFLLNLKTVPISYTPANWRRMLDIAKEFKPDVIHQVNHIFDTVLLSSRLARRTGIPLVCSLTTPIQHPNSLIHHTMQAVDRFLIGKFAARNWDRVICLDSEVFRHVKGTYGQAIASRGIVIAYGIRDSFLQTAITEAGVAKNPSPQIVLVGHIHALRDPTNLVRAMPMILERFPDARLVLAGRLQLQRPVKEAERLKVSASVDFMGEVPHRDVSRLLRSSHVFAGWASGPYTGLGTAAIETMLCGTPIVIDAPENLFGDGVLKNWDNIVLVDRDNIDSIGKSIIRLLEDDALRRHIGAKGREFVLKFLQWDRIVEQVEKVYMQLRPSD